MRQVIYCAALVAVAVTGLEARAPAGPRAAYQQAVAREQALVARATTALPAPVSQLRAVMAAYENVVRRFPRSGYADDALWRAAVLARDLYKRTGQELDRRTASRLLTTLTKGYPSSSLIPEARAALRQLQTGRVGPPPARERAPASRAPAAIKPPASPMDVRAGSETLPLPADPIVKGRDLSPPAVARVAAPSPPSRAVLRGITRSVLPDIVRVTLELDSEVQYRNERPTPTRVALDLPGAETVQRLKDRTFTYSDGTVAQIGIGRTSSAATRVTLDLDERSRYSVFTLYTPFRIVIDVERPVQNEAGAVLRDAPRIAPPARASAAAAPLPATRVPLKVPAPAATLPPGRRVTRPAPIFGKPLPRALATGARSPRVAPASPLPAGVAAGTGAAAVHAGRAGAEVPQPLVPSARPPATLAAPAVPSANSSGGFSLARQLGLGISRVVIDPGHGGHDPGALGKKLGEAELVLDVALRLEQLLLKEPGIEVVLTRRADVFIPLEERTAIANRENADLFLSIHANASRNARAAGIETYFLNFATNSEAEAVAARENSASARAMHSLPEIVKAIALNNKVDESRDLAWMVQQSMVARLKKHNGHMRDLGVKQAPFVVLIGAGMPSVLAEIAFVTNVQEAALLRTSGYRQRIAEALLEAVLRYQRSLKAVTAVASQDEQ